ncbi:MAG: hypothetical protein D6753_13665 [Planctomycetota bacterium]|nr:MAG: hypothetical protein D6753_13665 [Planctomycetota bacterium]
MGLQAVEAQTATPRLAISPAPQLQPEDLRSIEDAFNSPADPTLDLHDSNPADSPESGDPQALDNHHSPTTPMRPGTDSSRLPAGHLTAHEAAILGTVQDVAPTGASCFGPPRTPNAIHAAMLRQRCAVDPWCGYDAEVAYECQRLQSQLTACHRWHCPNGRCAGSCIAGGSGPAGNCCQAPAPCSLPASACDAPTGQ